MAVGHKNLRKMRTIWTTLHAPRDRRRVCYELLKWEAYWIEDRYIRALAHPKSFRLSERDKRNLDNIWERLFGNDNV